MAYADDEKSTEASAPVELYTLTAAGTTYRYTSHPEDYVFGGNTYTAIPIQRSSTSISTPVARGEVSVDIAMTAPFCAHLRGGLPAQGLTCTITRVQQVSGQSRVLWAGDINGFTGRGHVFSLRVANSTDDTLAQELPAYKLHKQCSHQLYDSDTCRVVRAAFTVTTTIASMTGPDITLTSDGGNPDGWAVGGELENTTTNDKRSVIAHVGNVVTLSAPFRANAAAGNGVKLYAGCDRSVVICGSKFSNVLNFGGHPHIVYVDYWKRKR